MRLCAITDRQMLGEDEGQRMERVVALAAVWARGGVDFIQVREKDLAPEVLKWLVRRVVDAVGEKARVPGSGVTRVLVNGPDAVVANFAVGAGADGVHLPGGFTRDSISDSVVAVRSCFAPRAAIVSVACHSHSDVEWAREAGADLVLFAPVFGKTAGASSLPGVGLELLAGACAVAGAVPVFALGGITSENARLCGDAGASGAAGIRLFLDAGWKTLRDNGGRVRRGSGFTCGGSDM